MLSLDYRLTLLLNGSDYAVIDTIAMACTKTVTWIPLYVALLFVLLRRRQWREMVAIVVSLGLCVLIADQIASGVFKPLVCRPRPSHDPALAGLVRIVGGYRGGEYGFFSSHAANTFAVTTFVAKLQRSRWVTGTLLLWAVVNCWTRVYLGLHFVSDILCGIVCGVVVGYAVFWAYRWGASKLASAGR